MKFFVNLDNQRLELKEINASKSVKILEYGGKVQYFWQKLKIPHIRTALITVIEKNANNCLEETY